MTGMSPQTLTIENVHLRLLLLGLVASVYGRPQILDLFQVTVDFRCPANGQRHLLPHDTDPTKFHFCVHGMKMDEPQDCSPGTEFIYEEQDKPPRRACILRRHCEYKFLFEINRSRRMEQDTVQNRKNMQIPAKSDCVHWLVPHPSDCNRFYYCVFGQLVERNCPGGLEFNPAIQVCDWPSNAGCVGCPADFTIHRLLPDPTDCNRFLYCVFGDTQPRYCPPGLHFNPNKQVCDWSWNAGCVSNRNSGSQGLAISNPGNDGEDALVIEDTRNGLVIGDLGATGIHDAFWYQIQQPIVLADE
ncbi:jg20393 [Pararge aegeria aegeria]|uniref:Jg20393 protein n=1 Tax=Pararge aegeria aegeria TaxID=348720 RepID=A0A8S4S6D0_9NEOP|nr:jg20393 [Pararge aegeria aegeria]